MNPQRWKLIKGGLLLVAVSTILVLVLQGVIPWRQCTPALLRTYVMSFGWWSPAIYAAICAQPLVPLPASVIFMAGGLAFGLGYGMLVSFAAILCRAIGQFFIARHLGRGAVESLLRGRLASLDERIGRNQFETVFWIRVLPNLPFDAQNLCLGLSPVSFTPYMVATVISLIPATWLWVYLGDHLAEPGAWWKITLAVIAPLILLLPVRWVRQRRASVRVIG